jgi:hypothetical protein
VSELDLPTASSERSNILAHNKRNEVINMTSTKCGTQSLCIVLSILTYCTLSAQSEPPRVRNIVLVHGAWADGSGWKDVYDILVKDGYNISIVQEPETSFKEDVAATKRVLAQQDGPCILVAHSMAERSLPKRARIHRLPV